MGQRTTMTGTGILEESVSGATFNLEMTGSLGKLVSCSGDASVTKTCPLPLGTGTITFTRLTFPINPGSTSIKVDIELAGFLPPLLAATATIATASTSSGHQLFCLEIHSHY